MARPVVGIHATVAPVSWGPWRDRPSAVVPAPLAAAVWQAGGVVVLLAPDPELGWRELLGSLDALIVFDDADDLDPLRAAGREAGITVLVLDAANITPASPVEDYAREIRGLLA
jgi:putative glutamine amidotransferase